MRFNKEPIRDFFVFSRKERSGIIGLLLLVALAILLHYFFDQYTFPVSEEVISALQQYKTERAQYEAEQAAKQASLQVSNEFPPEISLPEGFLFDPNTADDSTFLATGLNPNLVNRILNYREKGGRFKSKIDLLKIYNMDTLWYNSTEAFISIASAAESHNSSPEKDFEKKKFEHRNSKAENTLVKFNLNEADTNQLKALKGIASYSANKIVKYRDRLGGFLSIEEVDSVWGISEVAKQELKKNCYVTQETIKKISVNTATLEELKQHPYISYSVAKVIVAYRDKHGAYMNLEHIKRTDLVDDQLYSKIAPYLKL